MIKINLSLFALFSILLIYGLKFALDICQELDTKPPWNETLTQTSDCKNN